MARESRVDTSALLNEASALIGAYPYSFFTAASVSLAVGTWIELQPGTAWNDMLFAFVGGTLFVGILQYLILRRILNVGEGGSRIGTLLAPSVAVTIHVLVTLVVMVGYLLLLVPGLYLAGRLSPAVGLAVAERRGVVESIAESWRRSRRAWRALLLAQVLLLLPMIALFGLAVAGTFLEWGIVTSDELSLESALLGNLATSVIAMAGWAITGAAYRLTAPRGGEISEVFE